MKDSTPYYSRPAGERKRERDCMQSVFAQAPKVGYVYEAFGGIGMTAEVLRDRFPGATIEATDTDAECVRLYNAANAGHARQMDALAFVRGLMSRRRGKWGASLDYNRFTIFDLRGRSSGRWKVELLDAIVERKPEWVQLTDSAVRYLHLNARHYGMEGTGLNEYVALLSKVLYLRTGYRTQAVSAHYAATYLLLRKGP